MELGVWVVVSSGGGWITELVFLASRMERENCLRWAEKEGEEGFLYFGCAPWSTGSR